MHIDEDTKRLVKREISDIKEALTVIEEKLNSKILTLGDRFALRYAIIQIVESLAIVASRLAHIRGIGVEGYMDAMRFLARLGVVDTESEACLVRLARLRNLVIHRYWSIIDELIVEEAKRSGIKCIEAASMAYRDSWSKDMDRMKGKPPVKVRSADKEAILFRIKDVLEGDSRILLAVVFGSFTRYNTIRDIDLAVYMVGFTDAFDVLEYCEELSSKLSSIIGIPVDVVPLQYSRDSVFNETLIHGTPIIMRDPRLYEALRLLALDQYEWIASRYQTII